MKFPTLKENEFSVLMANCETGIVIDANFKTFENNIVNHHVFSVFADIEQVKDFINKVSEENNKIEFIVYNSKQELYDFVKAKIMR